eukprot:CAMPEP_0202919698 /NCGR_PEP_ID=MMETSP1392-20130828/76469_1 /ASSEMBLY_ACC=CAM_ASM_000868 /TAXON_ID=225041 /ORGANISM="Chlamydomonas chlamydogama, Strain SAG 11-48b" /LENGTH=129 /DNA_ID=CAMNT_0049613155 /DNA_START=204 /DNA_END=593 /DNA_ORIENTATION=-
MYPWQPTIEDISMVTFPENPPPVDDRITPVLVRRGITPASTPQGRLEQYFTIVREGLRPKIEYLQGVPETRTLRILRHVDNNLAQNPVLQDGVLVIPAAQAVAGQAAAGQAATGQAAAAPRRSARLHAV